MLFMRLGGGAPHSRAASGQGKCEQLKQAQMQSVAVAVSSALATAVTCSSLPNHILE